MTVQLRQHEFHSCYSLFILQVSNIVYLVLNSNVIRSVAHKMHILV